MSVKEIKDGAFESAKPEKTNSAEVARSLNKKLARNFKNKRGTIRIDNSAPKRQMSETKKAAAELLNAKTQNQPIAVEVRGLEPVKPNSQSKTVMTPVAEYHGWKIIIPRTEFLEVSMMRPDERNDEGELSKRLYQYIGAEVDIIPTAFFPELKTVVASRRKALEIRKAEYWFGTNTQKKKNSVVKEDLIKEGSRIEARIVSVTRGMVFIEAFGVESAVGISEVSYARIQNCKNRYKPGDVTAIIIKSIKKDEDTGHVSFTASIKEAYPDPREDAFKRYVRGGLYKGKVTMIQTDPAKSERSGAFVSLPGPIDIFCNYPRNVSPSIGDIVTVAVSGKDQDNLWIWGNITHIERQMESPE